MGSKMQLLLRTIHCNSTRAVYWPESLLVVHAVSFVCFNTKATVEDLKFNPFNYVF